MPIFPILSKNRTKWCFLDTLKKKKNIQKPSTICGNLRYPKKLSAEGFHLFPCLTHNLYLKLTLMINPDAHIQCFSSSSMLH